MARSVNKSASLLCFFLGVLLWRGYNIRNLASLEICRLSSNENIFSCFQTTCYVVQLGPSCGYDLVAETSEADVAWLRAYMEGPRSWDLPPPDPSSATVLCRKYEAQKHRQNPAFRPIRTFHEKVLARAQKAAKDKKRLLRKLEAFRGDPVDASSSSSSSSSSSDSSTESEQ